MKKNILNVILLLCAVGLGFTCYESISSNIKFDEEKTVREDAVETRLEQIKSVEELYKKTYGHYCGSMDSLVAFVQNEQVIKAIKNAFSPTDEMLERNIVTPQAALAAGLLSADEMPDTVFVSAAEMLGIEDAEALQYIPVGRKYDGQFMTYQRAVLGSDAQDSTVIDTIYYGKIDIFKVYKDETKKVGEDFITETEELVEFRASLDDYMDGLPEKMIKNLKNERKKMGKSYVMLRDIDERGDLKVEWYGLRMGDVRDTENRMTGNWD